MKKMALVTGMLAVLAGPASAADWYLHSGDRDCSVTPQKCSVMEAGMMDLTRSFVITYARPKPGLREIGIGPGELLVSGQINNGVFVGTARRYKMYGDTRCSLPYQVTGIVLPRQNFVLHGAAPSFARNRCTAADYSMDNDQSVLNFYYFGSGTNMPNVSFQE